MTSAGKVTDISLSMFKLLTLLIGMISIDKAPDIQVDERELFKLAARRIGSCQLGTRVGELPSHLHPP